MNLHSVFLALAVLVVSSPANAADEATSSAATSSSDRDNAKATRIKDNVAEKAGKDGPRPWDRDADGKRPWERTAAKPKTPAAD